MAVRSGAQEERTSSRFGALERKGRSWTAQSGPGGGGTGADRADVKEAVRQPLFQVLSLEKLLDAVLEAMFRGPVLSLFAVAERAASDRIELRS